MDGILNINKPRGITSHDVVSIVRRTIGENKIGHTGTLDPIATGILLLCIGRATKLSRLLTGCKKTYIAEMRLGIKTDTQDATGNIISACSTYSIDEMEMLKIFSGFTGDIEQIPPMYSAVKYKGERLYKMARRGITVERKAKKVHIYSMKLISANHEFVKFEVEASPGTYIRTLCEQIGDELGCGGHMFNLQRIRIGNFQISDSLPLDVVEVLYKEGRLKDAVIPMHCVN
ncbi:MAG: tRNA pseudouridine(55) synthase TruB [Nitrospinae bacterium RIFCSPLOWO2_02_39_17]|nr:MAG: tRNA pseudouridine(55) synthase TruB [Nitrospinae bacterium RIFCSPHIGHO2_02_39_11]OGW00188.1 MAG: tRNA pseudouridine(55) synthase TruB [Nitrospinae bacterium RIFCSPHIGHO2_12_FULL_39_42]OGW00401.1 MAG: tRNA pseudouridine(55) synthase TruB [Nitrospinae bacterium RIFCSPHIGHO2_02_FULL_39_82]OGW03707.1 MAG: tRNA pseudouridine(55) synthase TruB [Nitrospinae bacterium RIFCSPLOWO2_02_39_17]OGW08405.1 MAG: tRNA pseudouridine(55) synthase TruB [Nitrospinae bacterium RIFCSPLOWO2_12_39_15]OGW12171